MSIKSIMITAAFAGLTFAAAPAQAGEIEVTINGLQPDLGGKVMVSLQEKESFMQPRGTAGAYLYLDGKTTLTTTLEDVPPGEYALSVMHDANDNGHMDFQDNGWPEEGWAMSGDAPMDRAPTFADARFTVVEGDSDIAVDMVYPGSLPSSK